MATRTKKSNPSLTSAVDAFNVASLDVEEIRNAPGFIEQTDMNEWHKPREVRLGAIVQYVMYDGVTIRPAIVVAFFGDTVNLQVFVDGGNDEYEVRGQHASSTLQDWKRGVAYDPGKVDESALNEAPTYKPNTWHWDAY